MPRTSTNLHPTKTQTGDSVTRNGCREWWRLLVSGAGKQRRSVHLPTWRARILIELILGFLPAMAVEIRWAYYDDARKKRTYRTCINI